MSTKKIIRLNPNPKNFGDNPDELKDNMFASGLSKLPIQNTHSDFENDDIGLYIGVWDTTDMTEKADVYPCDELMFLLEGQVEIKNNRTGELEKVVAGEAFIIPKGYDCQWIQKGYCRKFYMISEHPDEDIPVSPSLEGIVILKINEDAKPDNHIVYKNGNNKFNAGTWSSQPFETDFSAYSKNELVKIIKGKLILTESDKTQHVFEKDDVFFIPQGAVTKWQSTEYLEVFYGG